MKTMEMGCLNIMQTSQNSMAGQVYYAGFFVRLAAYLIDITIVWLVLFIVRLPIWAVTLVNSNNFLVRDLIFEYSIRDMLLYVLSAAYFILLTYFTGSTLGKKLFNIKVVSAEDRKFTLFEIVFRETVGRFLSKLIIFVGYFMIGIDTKKRGLHDILSDTCVVYKYYAYKSEYGRNINGDILGPPNKDGNINEDWNMSENMNANENINANHNMDF